MGKSDINPKSSNSAHNSILIANVPSKEMKKDTKDVPQAPAIGANILINDSKLPNCTVGQQSENDKTRHSSGPKEKRSKKLSLKDYKAKKEAEKLRRSMEESGSESGS